MNDTASPAAPAPVTHVVDPFDIPACVGDFLDTALELEQIGTRVLYALSGKYGNDYRGLMDEVVFYAHVGRHTAAGSERHAKLSALRDHACAILRAQSTWA